MTGLVLSLALCAVAVAQTYRDNLPLPLNEILQNMSNYCEAQDFERLKKAMVLLHPVTTALAKEDASLSQEMDKALAGKDAAAALSIVHRIAWADARELLLQADKNDDRDASRHIKAAFLDYTVISPTMQSRNFAADQHIKNAFKRASAAELPPTDRHLILTDIEASAMKAYPVLK